MIYSRNCLFSILIVVLSGCAVPTVPSVVKRDPASISLDEVLSFKATPKPIGPETIVVRPTYGAKTSVSFMGDASSLLADAAKGRGADWTFSVTGPQPRLPIYVQVNVKDVPFADFLNEVAGQLGQRADIALNGKSNIELRYRAQN